MTMGKEARKGIEVGERTNQATVSRDQSRVEGSVVVGQAGEEVAPVATWVPTDDVLDLMRYLFKYDGSNVFLGIFIKSVPLLPVPDYPRRTDRADAGLMSELLVDTGKAGP